MTLTDPGREPEPAKGTVDMVGVVRVVGVVGSGLMGAGIAQVSAQAGYRVLLNDMSQTALDAAMRAITESYAKFVAKGSLTADDAELAKQRITPTSDFEVLAEADVVVEAVFESLEVKRRVFGDLDRVCSPHTVMATNTSAIPITTIAEATSRPEQVVGTHFFSPVPLMRLCELVRGERTSDETLAAARTFAESTGKTCVVVNKDVPGFVTTRLIAALALEAARLVERGVATAQDIDVAAQLGFGHAMGPLATLDLTGIDIMVDAADTIDRAGLGDGVGDQSLDGTRVFSVPSMLRQMVDKGTLGRKTGRGFYSY